jgi:hypothetical protein
LKSDKSKQSEENERVEHTRVGQRDP